VTVEEVAAAVESGDADVAIAGILITTGRVQAIDLSQS
jgi:ABC-type amino acid transport substrate-binding protein